MNRTQYTQQLFDQFRESLLRHIPFTSWPELKRGSFKQRVSHEESGSFFKLPAAGAGADDTSMQNEMESGPQPMCQDEFMTQPFEDKAAISNHFAHSNALPALDIPSDSDVKGHLFSQAQPQSRLSSLSPSLPNVTDKKDMEDAVNHQSEITVGKTENMCIHPGCNIIKQDSIHESGVTATATPPTLTVMFAPASVSSSSASQIEPRPCESLSCSSYVSKPPSLQVISFRSSFGTSAPSISVPIPALSPNSGGTSPARISNADHRPYKTMATPNHKSLHPMTVHDLKTYATSLNLHDSIGVSSFPQHRDERPYKCPVRHPFSLPSPCHRISGSH